MLDVLFFKDFHQLSQSLLLWLESAESRRQQAHVTDPKADPLGRREELLVSLPLGGSAPAGQSGVLPG